MRQIVLDTETTGLEVQAGHRIIEIGCVEILHRRLTGARFHRYLNPARDIESGAMEVHGISAEFLADKPSFAEVADEFLEFICNAEVIIHNAAFDVGFINHELAQLDGNVLKLEQHCRIFDSLDLARRLHTGQRNSLDALCKRYNIDASHRELHGALLDAELLARTYLAMTGGQADLSLDMPAISTRDRRPISAQVPVTGLPIIAANAEEQAAHAALMQRINAAAGRHSLWARWDDKALQEAPKES